MEELEGAPDGQATAHAGSRADAGPEEHASQRRAGLDGHSRLGKRSGRAVSACFVSN